MPPRLAVPAHVLAHIHPRHPTPQATLPVCDLYPTLDLSEFPAGVPALEARGGFSLGKFLNFYNTGFIYLRRCVRARSQRMGMGTRRGELFERLVLRCAI